MEQLQAIVLPENVHNTATSGFLKKILGLKYSCPLPNSLLETPLVLVYRYLSIYLVSVAQQGYCQLNNPTKLILARQGVGYITHAFT